MTKEVDKISIVSEPDVIVTVRWSPSNPDPAARVSVHVVAPMKPTAMQVYQALSWAQTRVVSGMVDLLNSCGMRIDRLEGVLKATHATSPAQPETDQGMALPVQTTEMKKRPTGAA